MDADMGNFIGRAWKVGSHLDTDQILPSQYMLLATVAEMARHTLEGISPDFVINVKLGDVLVGGVNFGCGSSREQAPLVLKYVGIQAVFAKSFANIFYRNAINIGLPAIIAPDAVERISEGDRIEASLGRGMITNLIRGETYEFPPLPDFIMGILDAGGLLQYAKKK